MAENFQMGNGSWWEASRNRFDGGTTPATSSPTTPASLPPAAAGGSMVFYGGDRSSTSGLSFANQIVGLGLSSDPMDWNQAILPGEEDNTNFRSMLEEDMNKSHFQHHFLLDQSHVSAASSNNLTITSSQNFSTGFMGLLMSEKIHQPPENQQPVSNNYPYPILSGFGSADNSHLPLADISTPLWSPPEQPSAARTGSRSGFFPSDHTPGVLLSGVDEKPKDQNGSSKRSRSESPSPLPVFKVRKEKMGDRITALQQLVSPFGKTDTASVLSEAIEYIKFLHEQINALSSPYIKNGALNQHQQSCSKKKLDPEGSRQDLRGRGLCLVPIPTTFPMTNETTVDFWAPTFGGSFR